MRHHCRAIPNHRLCLRDRAILACQRHRLVHCYHRVLACHRHHDCRAVRSCLVHLVDPMVLSVHWYRVREHHHGQVRRARRRVRLILVGQRHQRDRWVLVGLVNRVAVLSRLCHSRLVVPSSRLGLSGRVVQLGISCIRIVVAGMVLHFPIPYCRFLSVPLVRVIHRVRCLRAVPVGRAGT